MEGNGKEQGVLHGVAQGVIKLAHSLFKTLHPLEDCTEGPDVQEQE